MFHFFGVCTDVPHQVCHVWSATLDMYAWELRWVQRKTMASGTLYVML